MVTEPRRFGILRSDGHVITDNHWTSISALMYGLHGFGESSIKAFGDLVVDVEGVWKSVCTYKRGCAAPSDACGFCVEHCLCSPWSSGRTLLKGGWVNE